MITCLYIKNKTLNIKIILKLHLKTLKKKYLKFLNRFLFYKN